MVKRTMKNGRIFLAVVVISLTLPILSVADNTGQDWYCSEPEEHAQYEKHLKLHLDHEAKTISQMLEKIYSDSSLTSEQKSEKTLSILDKYLVKIKAGIGD